MPSAFSRSRKAQTSSTIYQSSRVIASDCSMEARNSSGKTTLPSFLTHRASASADFSRFVVATYFG